jgi:hypothetical protein
MPDSSNNLLYHIVFSIKDRRPLITPEYQVRLYDYIGGTIRSLGGISINSTAPTIMFTCWQSLDQIVRFLTSYET